MTDRLWPTILLICSFAVALVLSEWLVRAWNPPPPERTLPEVLYDPHEVRRFDLRADQAGFTFGAPMSVDAQGFRPNGPEPRRAGGPRIVALGDSFTFGLGVRDEQTWPAKLERFLGTRDAAGVTVLNAGRISYDAFQELNLLKERLLEMEPAIVIHGLYWNDYMNDSPPDPDETPPVTERGYLEWDDPERRQSDRGAIRRLVNGSALFHLVRGVAIRTEAGAGAGGYEAIYEKVIVQGEVDAVNWPVLEKFYDSLNVLAESHGFQLKVVHFPALDAVRQRRLTSHPFAVRVRAILEERDIPYLDGFELWEKRKLGEEKYLPHNRHLNARGYRVIASALAERLGRREPIAGRRAPDPAVEGVIDE